MVMATIDDAVRLLGEIFQQMKGGAGGGFATGRAADDLAKSIGNEVSKAVASRSQDIRQNKENRTFIQSVKTYNRLVRENSLSIQRLSDATKYSGAFFQEAVNQTTSWERLNKTLPQKLEDALKRSGSELASNVKNFEDVLQINDMTKALGNTVSAIQGMHQDMSQATGVIAALTEFAAVGGNLGKISKELTPELLENYNTTIAETNDLNQQQKVHLIGIVDRALPTLRTETKKLADAQAIASHQMITGTERMRNVLSKAADNFFTWSTAIGAGTIAATQFANDVSEAMRLGTQGLQQMRGITMMMDPAEISRLQAANKQALLAVGDSEKWLDQVSKQQKDWALVTGDMTTAAQAAAGTWTILRRIGMTAEESEEAWNRQTAAQEQMLGTFKRLQKMTSMTADEFINLQKELITDQDHRINMMKMGKQERVLYMQSLNNRMAENIQMGMTVDQAKEVEKTFAAIRSKGPRERLRAAARMQMVGGALGIEGGGRLFELMRKGKRTDAEEKELTKLTIQMNDRIHDMAGSSSMSEQLLAEMIQTKIPELAGVVGQGSAATTKMLEGTQIKDVALSQYQVIEDSHKLIANGVVYSKGIFEILKTNPLLKGATAVAAFLGPVIASGIALGGGMAALGGAKGMGTAMLGTSGVLLRAGVFGAAAVGVHQFTQAVTTGTSDVYEWLGGGEGKVVDFFEDLFGVTEKRAEEVTKKELEIKKKAAQEKFEREQADTKLREERLEQAIKGLQIAMQKLGDTNDEQKKLLEAQLDTTTKQLKKMKESQPRT